MAGMADLARGAGVKVAVVEDVFNEVLKALCRGENVRINGFGVFERRTYSGRTLTSPLIPGEKVTFPDSFRMRFRQSQTAKHRLNVRPRRSGRAPIVSGGRRQPTVKGKKVAKKRGARKAKS